MTSLCRIPRWFICCRVPQRQLTTIIDNSGVNSGVGSFFFDNIRLFVVTPPVVRVTVNGQDWTAFDYSLVTRVYFFPYI